MKNKLITTLIIILLIITFTITSSSYSNQIKTKYIQIEFSGSVNITETPEPELLKTNPSRNTNYRRPPKNNPEPEPKPEIPKEEPPISPEPEIKYISSPWSNYFVITQYIPPTPSDWSPFFTIYNNQPVLLTPSYTNTTVPPNKGTVSSICFIEHQNKTYSWNTASSLNIINSTVIDSTGTPTTVLHGYSTYTFQSYESCYLIFKV